MLEARSKFKPVVGVDGLTGVGVTGTPCSFSLHRHDFAL